MATVTHHHFPFHFGTIKKNLSQPWVRYFGLGFILMVLGGFAISYAAVTTLISVYFVGSLLIVGSVATIYHAFQSRHESHYGFFLHLLAGILYAAAGLLMLANPLFGAVTLTFALSVFYLLLGASRIAVAVAQSAGNRGWLAVSGTISLLLGAFIWFYWPITSFWLIGMLVGIDIVFTGWWLTILGWSTRHNAQAIHHA